MTTLSYDDGVVRSSVVLYDGLWLEIRRGDLTGPALKAAGRRRWGGKEAWLAAVCAGTELQKWAVLGSYSLPKLDRYTVPGWTVAEGKEEMLMEIRFLQGRYNESRSERARLYWAEMLQDVAQVGYSGLGWREGRGSMWILDWPELARQIYTLCRRGRYTVRGGGYKEWVPGGFWFDILYAGCMGPDFVHEAPGSLPERLNLFV